MNYQILSSVKAEHEPGRELPYSVRIQFEDQVHFILPRPGWDDREAAEQFFREMTYEKGSYGWDLFHTGNYRDYRISRRGGPHCSTPSPRYRFERHLARVTEPR